MDATALATLSSLATAVITIACTKGVDAIIKYRKQATEECSLDDDRADRSYQVVIGKLEARVTALEAALEKSNARELECIRAQERLQAKVEMLERYQRSE